MAQTLSWQDRFYLIRTAASGNIFEYKPQFINTLPKFHGLEFEDAYFFIREFEKVYLMMRIPQLGDDAIRLCFIPLSLKDLAKK